MNFLIGMPGGTEWLLIIIALGILIGIPVAILVYAIRTSGKNKVLKAENDFLKQNLKGKM